ncbi:tol-pal system YbgF family protein [Streptomyces pratens]|uniref:Tol-pal system YbgF family protein n=1 Tax=Streptomyces pratens TaxID=887456 RepID=A0ABW1LVY2_9ACTN
MRHDPLAVALGNASLLGVGYLLMRRHGLFWTAAVVTFALVWTTVATAETWSEVLLLLWWAAVVAHGWLLARRRQGSPRTAQRLVALGLSVAVLLGVGLLRFDAHGIEDDIDQARADGDCGAVTEAQQRVWAGHRVAAAPVAARGDTAVDTCERLETAEARLAAGLNGDQDDLTSGFRLLASILEEDSRNDATVGASLDRFLDGLPTDDACETVRITDWLSDRESEPGRRVLDRSSETAHRLAPAALMGCGDALMSTQEWSQAESRYQRLLDEYPGDSHEGRARKAIRKAVLALQLDEVQELVRENRYCEEPAKYEGAPARRAGSGRSLFLGDSEHSGKLPGAWRTTDAAKAALVVCVGRQDFGSAVRTCPYRSETSGQITDVTFRRISLPVKVYALRTGKRVADRTVQISGSTCPSLFFTYGVIPSDKYVTPSKSDIRNAFSSVLGR